MSVITRTRPSVMGDPAMPPPSGMRVGLGQTSQLTDDFLAYARQLGVTTVQVNTPSLPGDARWEWDDIMALADRARDAGCFLEAIENVPIHFYMDAMMGGPRCDEQIANYQHIIRGVARAGIPVLGFHWMPNSVWRTDRAGAGRGGAHATVFDMADVDGRSIADVTRFAPPFRDMPISQDEVLIDADTLWANFVTFLDAVLPVAEEAGIRLALHPDDPPVPMLGGVARIFGTVEGFLRADAHTDSPAFALDLCLGCCSEMAGGAANVERMIRHFGPKGRIAYVHFRDVEGTVPAFRECFIDQGNFDAIATLRLLHESGFDGFLIDDHVPRMIDDTPYCHRGRAHAVGYMQGALAALGITRT